MRTFPFFFLIPYFANFEWLKKVGVDVQLKHNFNWASAKDCERCIHEVRI